MGLWERIRKQRTEQDEPVMAVAPEPVSAPVAAAPTLEPCANPIPAILFDADAYLAANPDVAAQVAAGETGAYAHYLSTGHADELAYKRPPSIPLKLEGLGPRFAGNETLLDRLVAIELEKKALLDAWNDRIPATDAITYGMISSMPDDALLPPLDRADCDESALTEDQLHWRRHGYVIKPGFIPDDILDAYSRVRERNPRPGGWQCWAPYMHIPELRDVSLYPPLTALLKDLIGEEVGLHLNLTGWVSTDRNFHQDDYLNPSFVNAWYAATWVALDDIHPDCGPFEFVPGSHRWPAMQRFNVRMFLTPEQRRSDLWPSYTEQFLNRVAQEEIVRRGAATEKFIAKKGDVLIWHGRLMHRGSYAKVPGMTRKALISHYSGLSHRPDMLERAWTETGGAYFVHHVPLDHEAYAPEAA